MQLRETLADLAGRVTVGKAVLPIAQPKAGLAPPLRNVGVEIAKFGGTAHVKAPALPSTPWYQLSRRS
ncbi:MAG: hypothetical protein JWP51_1029 [Bradyrhizobium sp.]|nr:hypothetical protein [Bradyrhizobium sp.]